MSRAATLVPPLPRVAQPAAPQAARAPESAAAAPFALEALQVAPRPQRDAALEAEAPSHGGTEVGPAGDAYEQEADAIARSVMRLPATTDTAAAPAGVQRACAACEAEDKVQRLSVEDAERSAGPPELDAAPGQLTSGGAPLGAGLRGFYETRLGRDLSAVRLHQGPPAAAMAESISARAFTYGSHIWLGHGESAVPTETLSHEMAHVLQQTQPAALETADAADPGTAAPAVQRRSSARWVPAKSPKFNARQGSTHDEVIKALSKANAAMLAEVPIPNAGRMPTNAAGIRPTAGYADLFHAATNAEAIPGVRLVAGDAAATPAVRTTLGAQDRAEEPAPEATAPKTTAPPAEAPADGGEAPAAPGAPTVPDPGVKIANFNKTDKTEGWGLRGHEVLKGGTTHAVTGKQHPRVVNSKAGPTITGTAKAPAGVRLGELKPGHNVEQRSRGATGQLPRYQRGLSQVAGAVGRANSSDGQWPLGTPGLLNGDADVSVPDSLSATSTAKTFHRELELRATLGKTKFRAGKTVPGRLVVGRDPRPTNPGVWTYIWVPQNPVLAAGMAAGQKTRLVSLTAELDKLVAELTAKPTKVAQKRPRPGWPGAMRPRVQRTPAKRTDPFDFGPWDRKRKTLFAPQVDTLTAEDLDSPEGIERGAAMEDAYAEIAEELKGFTAPRLGAGPRAELKALRRMQRMAGPLGGLLGRLRKLFGGFFIKAAEAFGGFKEKLDKRVNKSRGAAGGGGLGGWRKTVVVILTAAVVEAMKLIAADITHRFATCLDGMAGRLLAQLEAQLEQELEAEIEAAKKKLEEVIGGFDDIRARLESEAEPWLRHLDDIDAILDDAEKFGPYFDAVEFGVRAAVLAAGCSGLGIGCLLGALGQLAVPRIIGWMVTTDEFKEAVLNPIVHDLVEPIGAKAYTGLMTLLLGDPDANTLRGRVRLFADATPECKMPKQEDIIRSCGIAQKYPKPSKERRDALIKGAYQRVLTEHAGELRDLARQALRNPGGGPVTDDQVDGVAQAIEDAELNQDQLQGALEAARGSDGRVDLGQLRPAMERARERAASPPPLPGAPPATGKGGPGGLFIRKTMPAPGKGAGPRVKVGPLDQGPADERGGAPRGGGGIKVEF